MSSVGLSECRNSGANWRSTPTLLTPLLRYTGGVKATEFVFACEERAMRSLPPGFPRPERKVMWTILQLHYGNPNAHFELQPQVSRGQVELGLHFEGPVEQNDVWTLGLAERACELMAGLGDGWELEEWTSSWRRLHRVFRFEQLNPDLAHEVGEQLATALTVLQPFAAACAEGYVPPAPVVRPQQHSRNWRERRRARA